MVEDELPVEQVVPVPVVEVVEAVPVEAEPVTVEEVPKKKRFSMMNMFSK